jgi:hypothetical protein
MDSFGPSQKGPVLHNEIHDECKAEGHHREIRTPKPQTGVTDYPSDPSRNDASRKGSNERRKTELLKEHGGGIGSNAEEGHMAEAQISSEPSDQVPAFSKDDIKIDHKKEGDEVDRGVEERQEA